MILEELATNYFFEANRNLYSFSFNSAAGNNQGPYNLPTDWLRADRDDVFYTIQGVKYVMIPVALAEFNALVEQAGLNAYPENYAVDSSNYAVTTYGNPVMYVWPPAAGSYPVTAYYYNLPTDITTPESSSVVPWFPNQTYLDRRLTGEMLLLTGDARAAQFLGGITRDKGGEFYGAEALLDKYLKLQGDTQVVKIVKLDRRRFGLNFDRLKFTKLVGW